MDKILDVDHFLLSKEEFKKDVEQLWHDRRERDLESAKVHLNRLIKKWFSATGAPQTVDELLHISPRLGTTSLVNFISFYCAHLRSLLNFSESNKTLDLLENYLLAIGHFNFYNYHIEIFQRELEKGNFHKSLLHSSKMLELASSKVEKLIALINVLLSYENLGLDASPIEKQIFALKPDSTSPLVSIQQWTAYLARKYFRNGDFKSYLNLTPEKPPGQETFHMAWVYQIPYAKSYSPENLQDETIQFAINNSESYSVNTLLGIEDSKKYPAKMIQRCDRLYLWTWRWMTHSQDPRQTAGQVIATLKEILERYTEEDLTVEDRYLVVNSILWIGLFDRAQRVPFLNLTDKLQPQASKGYELFKLEYHIVSYLIAKDNMNKINMAYHLEGINNSPIKDLPLLSLIDALSSDKTDPHLSSLHNEIIKTLKIKTIDAPQTPDGVIDVASGEIIIKEKKKLNSLLLAKAIRCLYWNKHQEMPLDNFYEQVFSRESLQASNLRSRTHTLLSQVSKLFDRSISFHLNDNIIRQSGPWPKIFFKENSLLSEEIAKTTRLSFNHSQSSAPLAPTKASRSLKSLVTAVQSNPGVNRADLQNMLKLPKTTLRRFILQAINENKIHTDAKDGVCRYYPLN